MVDVTRNSYAWTQQSSCTHGLTVVVKACTKPVPAQTRSNFNTKRNRAHNLIPRHIVIILDNCWGREINFSVRMQPLENLQEKTTYIWVIIFRQFILNLKDLFFQVHRRGLRKVRGFEYHQTMLYEILKQLIFKKNAIKKGKPFLQF